MINCERFAQQLSDYLEGEVSEENYKLLNAHENSCKKCAELVINARLLSKMLKNIPAIKASENFTKNLRLKLAAETALQKSGTVKRAVNNVRTFSLKPVVVTFAAAASFFIAFILLDSYILDDDSEVLMSPRIEIPPLPGTDQNANANQNLFVPNQMQVGGFATSDSLSKFFQDTAGESLMKDDPFRAPRKDSKR